MQKQPLYTITAAETPRKPELNVSACLLRLLAGTNQTDMQIWNHVDISWLEYTSSRLMQIFVPICSLVESWLVAKSQNQSADFGQLESTDFAENHFMMGAESNL